MKKIKALLSSVVALLFLNAFSLAQISNNSDKNPCIPCEELKNIRLPDVIISQASQLEEPVTHCKISGTIGKEINFELLLPEVWNSRYLMGGNGGFAGGIAYFMVPNRVSEGYAVGGTDTGHKGSYIKADWALNNMERQVNFGHLAVHRTAVTSKEIIRQYYCSDSEYSYFIGCSRGGGQAMMEAQRYPNDFDGIVAGAPAFNWPAMGAEFIQNSQIIYPDPTKLDEPVISLANLELLQTIILDQCDAIDGIKDQILNDPRDCDFDVDLLPRCPENSVRDDCFTSAQIEAIKVVYAGVTDQQEEIYPGYPFGGENEPRGWLNEIIGPNQETMKFNYPSAHFAFGTEIFKYLVFQDPNWDYSSYDFSNFSKTTRYASSYLDATSTDYSAFKNRGGKMIIYHGWNDHVLSAFATIEHYTAAKKEDSEIGEYIRLFILPGVLHCWDGPGPSQTDWVELVRNWVEKGIAPERVILSKTEDEKVSMTRPVFPYPKKAIYDGKGDPNKESSFKSTTTNIK
ncbi:MAG: tannase/feruloyl esterase family alpha/beta hydrolase [Candidatus Marinimicrobia bacterium]|nr:tannase/feruloyl esterase family alpha/beta hydrolase [Candidatus Neomarinimicrobiota bacterium]